MRDPVLVRYRVSLSLFILGLVISGLTAFPLKTETSILHSILGGTTPSDAAHIAGLTQWVAYVEHGLNQTYARYPFFGYASDWLGFGHLVIAAFFILPFRDPVRYAGVLYVGLAACSGVVVTALVCGAIRGIPLGWQIIDCSFGVFGAVPLAYCLRLFPGRTRHR